MLSISFLLGGSDRSKYVIIVDYTPYMKHQQRRGHRYAMDMRACMGHTTWNVQLYVKTLCRGHFRNMSRTIIGHGWGRDVVSLHNTKAFLMTPLSFVPRCLFIFDGSSLNYLEVLFTTFGCLWHN